MAKGERDLIPIRLTTLELVYGNMDYVRSVFGHDTLVTRELIIDYYNNAKHTWSKCDYSPSMHRGLITQWCRHFGIRPLHYYAPAGIKSIWFREPEDAFAFKLKFGEN